MPLKLKRRGKIWYVRGTVQGRYCYETCGTSERREAELYRASRQAELFKAAILGQGAVVSLAEGALSYLEFEARSPATRSYVARLLAAIGADTLLSKIGQAEADQAVRAILGRLNRCD